METRFEVWHVQRINGRDKWGRGMATYATREQAEAYRVKYIAPHYLRSGVRLVPVMAPQTANI